MDGANVLRILICLFGLSVGTLLVRSLCESVIITTICFVFIELD